MAGQHSEMVVAPSQVAKPSRRMTAIANELWRANDLKEEEMGKSKGKGKEREEGSRQGRTQDKDGDMEMGRAGPSSLV
ncbi:hypothetical protein ID866_11629 [Astraeus odoratus]|nr:hypothetical protein ID866_11629 [Astraeus odoratus]